MNTLNRTAFLRSLIGLVLLLLPTANAAAQALTEEIDPAGALPGRLEFKGFNAIRPSHYISKDRVINSRSLSAVRTRDNLRFQLRIAIATTEDKAKAYMQSFILTNNGYIPPFSYTGRRFGDETWHSTASDDLVMRPSFHLVTRMERAVVMAEFKDRKDMGADPAELEPLDEEDMWFVEDLVIGCLQRLAAMGIGSVAKATPTDGPPVSDVLREVVTPIEQTPGFGDVRYKHGPMGNDEIRLVRKSDGLRLTVHLTICPTIQQAIDLVKSGAKRETMLPDTLTFKRLGQEAWHRIEYGEKAGNNYSLITRLGKAVLTIDVKGRAVAGRAHDPADLQTVDGIAVATLERLAAKGMGTQWDASLQRSHHKPPFEPDVIADH